MPFVSLRKAYMASLRALLLLPLANGAQTITLESPQPGDTVYVGDTVAVKFSADSLYRAKAAGTIINLSPDAGKTFYELCAIELGDKCPGSIPVSRGYWGNCHVVIPDTLAESGTGHAASVTSQALMMLEDYSGRTSFAYIMEGTFVILPANARPTCPENRDSPGACGKGALLALLPPLAAGCRQRRRGLRGCMRRLHRRGGRLRPLCFALGLTLISCNQPPKNDGSHPLLGCWHRDAAGSGTDLSLMLRKDGQMIVLFERDKRSYAGVYRFSGSDIWFTDLYCGTKLPGLYRFTVKEHTLRLDAVDDKYCDRAKLFTTAEWRRIDPPDLIRQASAALDLGAEEAPITRQ